MKLRHFFATTSSLSRSISSQTLSSSNLNLTNSFHLLPHQQTRTFSSIIAKYFSDASEIYELWDSKVNSLKILFTKFPSSSSTSFSNAVQFAIERQKLYYIDRHTNEVHIRARAQPILTYTVSHRLVTFPWVIPALQPFSISKDLLIAGGWKDVPETVENCTPDEAQALALKAIEVLKRPHLFIHDLPHLTTFLAVDRVEIKPKDEPILKLEDKNKAGAQQRMAAYLMQVMSSLLVSLQSFVPSSSQFRGYFEALSRHAAVSEGQSYENRAQLQDTLARFGLSIKELSQGEQLDDLPMKRISEEFGVISRKIRDGGNDSGKVLSDLELQEVLSRFDSIADVLKPHLPSELRNALAGTEQAYAAALQSLPKKNQ